VNQFRQPRLQLAWVEPKLDCVISDPRTTLGVYRHIIGDSQSTAVEKVANVLAPSGPKSVFSRELIQ